MINFSRCYITVGNLAKAIEFYSKVFGEPTYLEIGQWAWFNGQFVINQSSNQNICFCNIIPGFGVSTEKELENLYQSLLDSGKKVTAPKIVSNTPGYYYKYIRLTDDWGNSIEIAYSRKEITRVVNLIFKENLEKRFDSERFKRTLAGYSGNRENCNLCQEYREGDDCSSSCPFEKIGSNYQHGCIKFLQQAKVDLDLEYTIITLTDETVFTGNLKEFKEIVEYAAKYIEFY